MVKHPAATFYIKVNGESMQDANIHSGDILIVDRAIKPKPKSIVVARIESNFTVKRLIKRRARYYLAPENPSFKPIDITGNQDVEIWGVVTFIIHKAV
jgi:DNA polymerase V